MNQITMSSVDLDHTEACFASATSRGGEGRNDVVNAIDRKGLRFWIVISKSHRAWSHDIRPTPVTFGDGPVAIPRPVGAGFATGMRQLRSRDADLFMNK